MSHISRHMSHVSCLITAAEKRTSTFGASIDMYESASLMRVHGNDPVLMTSFEPMFIGVQSKSKDVGVGVKIVVDQCYASPC